MACGGPEETAHVGGQDGHSRESCASRQRGSLDKVTVWLESAKRVEFDLGGVKDVQEQCTVGQLSVQEFVEFVEAKDNASVGTCL